MRSPHNFIVTPLKVRRYDNLKEVGGAELITSVSQEDHISSNRQAKVVALPIAYKGPIKVGDTLIVHHNVFKFYYDMYGRQKSGKSFLKENLFLVDNEQFFLYKHKGQWKTYDRYCFVKPIKTEKNMSLDKLCEYEPLMGIMKKIYLKWQRINLK